MSTGDPSVFGQPGQYLVAGNGITISSNPTWGSLDLNLPDNKDFVELKERIENIEKRLAIIIPNKELQARFPALQEAYDHYKLIEKLVNDGGNK
jgi:hypothetical protein